MEQSPIRYQRNQAITPTAHKEQGNNIIFKCIFQFNLFVNNQRGFYIPHSKGKRGKYEFKKTGIRGSKRKIHH